MSRAMRQFRSFIRSAWILLACLSGLSAAGQPSSPRIAILVYHRFDPARPASTTVTVKAFESQLATLEQQGFQILPLERVTDIVLGVAAVPSPRIAAITVDDGHRSVYEMLFPLIQQRHLPVTLFIYTSAISRADYALTWQQLETMQASGTVDIQSHTYWHPDFRQERRRRNPADYWAFVHSQLVASRSELERRMHRPVDLLAWPYGIVDLELEAAAKAAGYRAAFGYDGLMSFPHDAAFAIHRIPMNDTIQGSRFASLLAGSSIHSSGEQVHGVSK